MTNEEFQNIVLEELKSLREGQAQTEKELRNLREGQNHTEKEIMGLREGQVNIEKEIKALREEQVEIKTELKAISEQTADLTEFREETNKKLDTIIEENDILKELIGKHEVSIRRIQRRIV